MGEIEYQQVAAVCFTCGAPAHKLILLPEGCAAIRMSAPAYLGICPQHEYSIEPIKTYTEIPPLDDYALMAEDRDRWRKTAEHLAQVRERAEKAEAELRPALKHIDRIDQAIAETFKRAEKAEAENARLRAALQPFLPWAEDILLTEDNGELSRVVMTARAALQGEGQAR